MKEIYITKDTLPQDVVNHFDNFEWDETAVDGLYQVIKDARDNDTVWKLYTIYDKPYIRRVYNG